MTSSGVLHPAYRMYSDIQGVLTEALVHKPDGSVFVAPVGMVGQSLAVPVPSRLGFTSTVDKPLAGARMIVKDLFDIEGIRTGFGNRAMYHLYGPANATAIVVQNLIEAGAVIVGKSKTTQFANGQMATGDWVDYHAPFNARGDGYQDPSGSSAGSGAAIGAYEWVDLAIGSDTGGSVRSPAQVSGVYGNRPTWNLVSLEHAKPLAPELDTAGLLVRDPTLWVSAAKALYQETLTFTTAYPKEILTVDFRETGSPEVSALLQGFVSKFSAFLGATVTSFNVTEAWATNPPPNTSVPLSELLNLTYPILISQEQIKLLRDPFYADYAKAHEGRRPFVDPVPLTRWKFGEESSETIERAVANKTLFGDWFTDNVLPPADETCSERILLYVAPQLDVQTRNRYLEAPLPPWGFNTGTISPMWGGPDFVLPIGQARYNSSVTMHEELLPVTVNIMAARGCDGMIYSLVKDLHKAGVLSTVKAGRSSFDGGEILYK